MELGNCVASTTMIEGLMLVERFENEVKNERGKATVFGSLSCLFLYLYLSLFFLFVHVFFLLPTSF